MRRVRKNGEVVKPHTEVKRCRSLLQRKRKFLFRTVEHFVSCSGTFCFALKNIVFLTDETLCFVLWNIVFCTEIHEDSSS